MSNILHQIIIEQNQTFLVDFVPFEKTKQEQYVSPGVMISYILLLLLAESLGNFLLFCMILYEKYGMDPQKRTVTNQLLSRMIFVQILYNIFILPLLTAIEIIGPFSKYNTVESHFCHLQILHSFCIVL